jgi:hypothetical protein
MIQPYVIKNIYYVSATLQCNICPTLTHSLSSYSEMIWTQGFFYELCLGGSTKRDHTIMSVERWQMVVGDKKFGVVSYVLVGGSGVFSPRKFFVFFHPYKDWNVSIFWNRFLDIQRYIVLW